MSDSTKADMRLKMLSSLARRGKTVLDIGTDHAYLPVYLIENGISKSAVAADVVPGPLDNAKKTVEKYGLSDKIKLYLSDGFDSVPENCAEDIVLAGMGGTLITELLDRCKWIKNKAVRLILQPMTHHENIRRWLCENGFKIVKEAACFDTGRVYSCIAAEYDGEDSAESQSYYFIGELPESDFDRLAAAAFLNKQYLRIKQRRDALQKCGRNQAEYETLCEVAAELEKYL